MYTVGSFEAKTHLPDLLRRVANGETIQITKRGTLIAMLVPPISPKKNPRKVAEEIRQGRKGISLGEIRIQDLIHEGRRYC